MTSMRFSRFGQSIVLALAFAGTVLPVHAAEGRAKAVAVLRDAFRSTSGWVKIHAADALGLAGEGCVVRDALAGFADGVAADSPLGYRIGVWRALANAASSEADRSAYLEKIRAVAFAAGDSERGHAIESLAKLGYVATLQERHALIEHAQLVDPGIAPLIWWAAGVGGSAAELERVRVQLLASVGSVNALARTRGAYALRFLGVAKREDWLQLADVAARPDPDPLARAYLASAAYVLAPSAEDAERFGELVAQLARNGTPPQRYEALQAIGLRGTSDELPLLCGMLANDDADTRIAAADAILKIIARGRSVSPATSPMSAEARRGR